MESALIGLLGVIIGILLAEFLRRKTRIESLFLKAFEKRLEVYEQLFDKLRKCENVAHDIIENPEYSQDERTELWGSAVLDLAQFTDNSKLYLDEDISVHCVATMMGVEDIYSIESSKSKDAAKNHFFQNLNNAKEMIRKETGLADLDKLFRSITKAKHESPVINYLNKLREKQKRKSQKR
jgi:hypothetical protein